MIYQKNGRSIELFYLTENDLSSQEFIDFINSKEYRAFMHADSDIDLYIQRMQRFEYYKSYYELKVLGVRLDGRFVGQSCAFRSVAIVKGHKTVFWWGADMYLFEECRGLGIGRALQQKLHVDLPNFSSAWYTPVNGIIKEKCGAHGIFDIWFNYYPVSSALTVFGDLCFRKLFKRAIPIRLSLPFFYSSINNLFIDSKLSDYDVREICYHSLGEKEALFMEKALSDKDFHIERSTHFLKWKYGNLKAGYYMISLSKGAKVEAIVAFSKIYNTGFDVAPIRSVAIYDMVVSQESELTDKQLLLYVARWYKNRKLCFDGFQMLTRVKYIGRMCYPFHSCKVLSTIDGKYNNNYLTLADQDMDQI